LFLKNKKVERMGCGGVGRAVRSLKKERTAQHIRRRAEISDVKVLKIRRFEGQENKCGREYDKTNVLVCQMAVD